MLFRLKKLRFFKRLNIAVTKKTTRLGGVLFILPNVIQPNIRLLSKKKIIINLEEQILYYFIYLFLNSIEVAQCGPCGPAS